MQGARMPGVGPHGQRTHGGPVPNEPGTRYFIGTRQMAVPQRRSVAVASPSPMVAQRHPSLNAPVPPRPAARVYASHALGPAVKMSSAAIHQNLNRDRFPRSSDKSRGLRHFSSRVCEKVKEKVQTNYNEVADELVAEYFDTLSYPHGNQDKQQYDSKNIRRRVYDALNVLMAMNIIEKEKKEIRWVGLPTSSLAERRRLEDERNKRRERIKQKNEQLKEYIVQVDLVGKALSSFKLVAYKTLVLRNRDAERTTGRPAEQSILYLPFIVINTERKTYIDCAISQDKTEYAMTFDRPFEIHDDIEVLKRLGMASGLDGTTVSEEKVEEIKNCLPPALRVYVDSIIEDKQGQETFNSSKNSTGNNGQASLSHAESNDASVDELDSPAGPLATSFDVAAAAGARSATSTPQTKRYNLSVRDRAMTGAYMGLPQALNARPSVAGGRTTTIQRSYTRQVVAASAGASTRYVQPSQSAAFQSANARSNRQLYVVNAQGSQQYMYQTGRQGQTFTYVQPQGEFASEDFEYQLEVEDPFHD